MTEQRIRHLPVVDDFGRLSDLVSIGDVVKSHISQIVWTREPHDVPRSQATNSGVIATAFIDGPKAEAVTEVNENSARVAEAPYTRPPAQRLSFGNAAAGGDRIYGASRSWGTAYRTR